ncbi:helix-turn-helix domain-containing protein [Paraburkholderia sp.]|uniref:GlxA family transcriptional regulator n=1 Tax=Paraburkholderia sp. TaxID=1926495 RepID=UPI0023862A05|nr:helix-turn-helix domain-containing protein [Paraburkholderia sp.]MDE1180417.1 helix-turn-helix domain-containing protein [Paraburkholderia sp.]
MGGSIGVTRRRRQVVVLLIEGFSLIHMGRLAEIFNLANRANRQDAGVREYYDLLLVSAKGGAMRSSSGVLIWTDAVEAHYAKDVHALFVLGGAGMPAERDERLLAWLRHAHPHTKVVQGVGGGHKILELAGLARKDVSSVEMPAGIALSRSAARASSSEAGEDDALASALSVVKRDCGYETAREVAEDLLPTSSHQFARSVFDSREARASDLIRAAAHQLRIGSENRISIADAAQSAAMSERNFLRRFKQEIGVTPTEFVLRVRLEKACYMLVDTDLPADKIARRTGLGSGDRLAKLFRQHLSMSPTEYRNLERGRLADNGTPGSDVVKRVRRSVS